MKIVLEHLTKQFPPRGRKAQEPVTAVAISISKFLTVS